ncbi:MAG: hypothetical protein U0Q22_11000 [Acidimicrobiales bacterium]
MQQDTEEQVRDLVEVITLALGTSVEVRRRFDQEWARGFEVASAAEDGYRLRRRSDGAVLPVSFPADDVRRSSVTQ